VLCSKWCPCPENGGDNKRIQDCQTEFRQSEMDLIDRFTAIGVFMENTYSCSGICTPAAKYIFTDVSDGAPNKSCGNLMVRELENESL
jgi:hypothetical protein